MFAAGACVCVCAGRCLHVHAYSGKCYRRVVRACMCAHERARARARIRALVLAGCMQVLAYVRVCARACVCVCECACKCVSACLHRCLRAHMRMRHCAQGCVPFELLLPSNLHKASDWLLISTKARACLLLAALWANNLLIADDIVSICILKREPLGALAVEVGWRLARLR